MSRKDPYLDVRTEVESSLLSAKSLHSSYHRILLTLPIESHSTSEELLSTRSELESILSTLLSDITELDHVVRILEEDVQSSSSSSNSSSKSKFGVSFNEVKKRKAWVTHVQKELNEMKKSLEAPRQPNPASSTYHPLLPSLPTSPANRSANSTKALNPSPSYKVTRTHPKPNQYSHFGDAGPHSDIESQTEEYLHQQESMLLEQQDATLGSISNVVVVLREQANVMGQEISQQNILLNELDREIHHTETKLSKANRKLVQFIEDNKNSKSSWTVLILTLILTCLLFTIIFV